MVPVGVGLAERVEDVVKLGRVVEIVVGVVRVEVLAFVPVPALG